MDRFAQYKWVLQLKGISIWCTWILGVQCIFVGSKGILSETQVFTIAKGDAVEAKKRIQCWQVIDLLMIWWFDDLGQLWHEKVMFVIFDNMADEMFDDDKL